MLGRIKFYNEENNYGFITGDDGNDYYFNVYGLEDKDSRLFKETVVEFDLMETPLKPKAINVRLV
jgi:cold shock CspA family protein